MSEAESLSPEADREIRPDSVLEVLGDLGRKLSLLEDTMAEMTEEMTGLRKDLREMKSTVAKAKQVKKLKKILDQVDGPKIDGQATG